MFTAAFLRWSKVFNRSQWLMVSTVPLAVTAVFWICTFKIMDRDFWWHITAGNIMLQTHSLIQTDPFAFVREGLPYLATHEWLAQIIFALIYNTLGSTGVILFRGVIALTCVVVLLLLSRRFSLVNILLGLWAVVIAKGSFLERPQLFTFVFFSLFLLLSFRFLDTESWRSRVRISLAFIGLELLWVNMHGAAALLGGAQILFVFLQSVVIWRREKSPLQRRTLLLLTGTLIAMALAAVSPPNGLDTLRYLWNLLHDQTILFIAEWQPRPWRLYLLETGPFWILALLALFKGRRHLLLNIFLLGMTGYLSRQAYRHEILFILASLATCYYQFGQAEQHRWQDWHAKKPHLTVAAALIAILLLGHEAHGRSADFERQDNLFGFGEFDFARSAYDFVEEAGLRGNMFNTYGIGGYLIHRGYPDRKVFIDGRNVDYGMDFMTRTYAAGINPQVWDELAERYDIAYALVDYHAIREKDRLPYSVILDQNPMWPLVYLDDWVAVYAKNIPSNKDIIDRYRYNHLTATAIQFQNNFPTVSPEVLPELDNELRRMQRDNPDGVKATFALASLALRQQQLDDAAALAQDALRAQPSAPEPYAILAAVYLRESRWEEAAEAYDVLLKNAGNDYPDINYGFLADVYEKAGRSWKAKLMRLKGGVPATAESGAEAEVVPETENPPSPAAPNPTADAEQFNERGITEAEQGFLQEAEQSFLVALKLNPSFAGAWNNLCAVYLHNEQLSDAIDACKKAVTLQADFADAHFNLALAYYRSGLQDEAEEEATLAIQAGRAQEGEQLLLLIRQMKL